MGINVIDPEDGVRVADVDHGWRVQHRRIDGSDLQLDAGRVYERLGERDVLPAKARLAHIDGDALGPVDIRLEQAGVRLDAHLGAAKLLGGNESDAARGVAARGDLGAVRIEDAHEHVGVL